MPTCTHPLNLVTPPPATPEQQAAIERNIDRFRHHNDTVALTTIEAPSGVVVSPQNIPVFTTLYSTSLILRTDNPRLRMLAALVLVECLDGYIADWRSGAVSNPYVVAPYTEGVIQEDIHQGCWMHASASRCLTEELGVPAGLVDPQTCGVYTSRDALVTVSTAHIPASFTQIVQWWHENATHAHEGTPVLLPKEGFMRLASDVPRELLEQTAHTHS